MESMLNYVSDGNTLFISADYIDQRLVDTLGAKTYHSILLLFFRLTNTKWIKKIPGFRLHMNQLVMQKSMDSFLFLLTTTVVSFDTSVTQVLGYNENKEAKFYCSRLWAGQIYFSYCAGRFQQLFPAYR